VKKEDWRSNMYQTHLPGFEGKRSIILGERDLEKSPLCMGDIDVVIFEGDWEDGNALSIQHENQKLP